MEKKNILTADFLDLLFDGRNKDYGAYDLRKTYNKRISYALAGTTLVCLLFIAGSIWANARKGRTTTLLVATEVELQNIQKEEPKPELPKPQPMPEQKIATIQNVVPRIVRDEDVKPEEEVKEVTQLEDAKIGTFNQEGAKDEGIVSPPVEKGTGPVVELRKEEDYEHIYYVVQSPAEYPGGMDAWRKFLERNLNRDLPIDNGAPPADYTVVISFTVDKEGKVSDLKAENDPGYGTKDEALRVIRKATNWVPAQQNGRKVNYRHKQAITFRVGAEQ